MGFIRNFLARFKAANDKEFPVFKYYADPLGNEAFVVSDEVCECCGKKRGYINAQPPYGVNDEYFICPWCVSDGTAYKKLDVTFNDEPQIPGGYFPDACEVDQKIIDEISQRTPGILTWQPEQWYTHCNDGGVFLGYAGYKELKEKWPEALHYLLQNPETDVELVKDTGPDSGSLVYVFQCRHCKKYAAYYDFD